jgi:hypothetical protein
LILLLKYVRFFFKKMNKNIIYISYLNISHELNKKIPLLTIMKSFAKIYIKLKYFIIYVIDL